MPAFGKKCLRILKLAFYTLPLLFLVIAPSLCQARAYKGRTVVVKASQTTYNLGPYLEFLEDKTGKLTLKQVTNPENDELFTPMAAKTLNKGITKSVFWFKFTYVLSQSPRTADFKNHPQWLLSPGFALPQRCLWQVFESDTPSMKSLQTVTDSGYELTGTPNHFKTVYFKVASLGPMAVNPKILSLHDYIKSYKLFLVLTGCFFGILIGVAFYHLVIYFAIRKLSYLWYVFHLLFLGIYFIFQNGFGNAIVNGIQSAQSTIPDRILLTVSLFFGVLFAREHLAPKGEYAIKRKIINSIILALSISCLVMPFVSAISGSITLAIIGFVAACAALFFSLAAWQHGDKYAGFFHLAWLAFLLGGIAYSLTFSGLVPYNKIIFNSLQFGAAISAIAFAVSLGSRIENLKKQKNSFQEQESRIRTILDSITSGILLVNPSTNKVIDINNQAIILLKTNYQSIVGANWKNYFEFLKDKPKDISLSSTETFHTEGSILYWQDEKIPVIVDANLIKLDNQDVLLINFKQISELKKVEQEREKLIQELKQALSEVKALTGLLPICAGCKKIRDDKGYWNQIDDYFREHSDVDFSHSLCPDCLQKLYPEMSDLLGPSDKRKK